MLYKYRTDNQYTEMIFTSGKVHLSVASALNDPFECSLKEIGSEWIKNEVSKMKQASIAGFLMTASQSIKNKNSAFGMSHKKLSKVINKLSSMKTVDEQYKYFRKLMFEKTGYEASNADRFFTNINEQLQRVGIFSLAESSSNELLWSHYGGEHYGICIGFDNEEPNSKLRDSDYCLKVNYSDNLPEMSKDGFMTEIGISFNQNYQPQNSTFQLSFTDSTLQRVISTKPTSWSYEEEWRYVEPSDGEYDWPCKITEIVFGLRCPKGRIEHYINLANKNVPHEVNLYQMVKVENSNKVIKTRYSTPKTTPINVLDSREYINDNGEKVQVLSAEQFSYAVEELIRQGNYDEALFQVENALLEAVSPTPHLISLKAIALGHKGDHEKALEEFINLDQLFPNNPEILYQISCALSACDRVKEATEILKKANMLPHEDPSIPYNIGSNIIRLNGDMNEALQYLITARSLRHPKASKLIEAIQTQLC